MQDKRNGVQSAVQLNPEVIEEGSVQNLENEAYSSEADLSSLFIKGSSFIKAKKEDIVGLPHVLEEIDPIIDYLKNYEKYKKENAHLEPGLLLFGKPGTGKTLVSRFIATESQALFIDIRDLPSPVNGESIKNVFACAREYVKEKEKPVILFWDELDAYCKKRTDASLEEIEISSQLLTELSGASSQNNGILLIGCTNHASELDKALLRSGRMGTKIEFKPPSKEDVHLLVEHYLKPYTKEELNYKELSIYFQSLSCAEIEEWVKKLWRIAIYKNKDYLSKEFIHDELIYLLVGQKRQKAPTQKIRELVAIHEIGHALVGLQEGLNLTLITCRSGQTSLGLCLFEREEYMTTLDMQKKMRMLCGSLALEDLMGLNGIEGRSGDIAALISSAEKLVEEYGIFISENGLPVSALYRKRPAASSMVSNELLKKQDDHIEKLVQNCYQAAKDILSKYDKPELKDLQKEFLEKETLSGSDFQKLVKKHLGET